MCRRCCHELFYEDNDPGYFRRHGDNRASFFSTSYLNITAAGGTFTDNACIDFVHNRYYAIRSDRRAILRASKVLDNVTAIFSDSAKSMEPALAVQPRSNYVFFAAIPSGDSLSHIYRIALDGSGLTDLLTMASGWNFGNGACLVASAGRLFYSLSNPPQQQMWTCDFDGNGNTLLFADANATGSGLGNMRSISIDNNHRLLYFTNFTQIRSMPFSGGSTTVLLNWDTAPLPGHLEAGLPGNRYILRTSNYSHLDNRLYFNLNGGQAPHAPDQLGLWSCRYDGSDIQPEVVFPNLKSDSPSDPQGMESLGKGRWIIGDGFERTGNSTRAHG
jgi:hypothetical protein